MSKQAHATWYIHPKNQQTNEAIARLLDETDACHDQLCHDGIRRNLWRCGHAFISTFRRSRSNTLIFDVFVREGKYGKIRQFSPTPVAKTTALMKRPVTEVRPLKHANRFNA